MKLIGLERLDQDDIPGAAWMVPSAVTSNELRMALQKMESGEKGDTLAEYREPKALEEYLKRKPAGPVRDEDDEVRLVSDSEGEESFDETMLFPAGGPTARTPDEPIQPKRRVLKRRNRRDVGDEEKEERAKKRKEKELEKRRKIKSDVFIHESDDESDDERDRDFFAKEEERRKMAERNMLKAIEAAKKEESRKRKNEAEDEGMGSRKRKAIVVSDGSNSDEEEESSQEREALRFGSDAVADDSAEDTELNIGLDSDEESEDDTPISSRRHGPVAMELDPEANKENLDGDKTSQDVLMSDDQDDEEDSPIKRPARRNIRAGFIIDDTDSE
jgi:replication fork protection complex subunit Tof1/Swi1